MLLEGAPRKAAFEKERCADKKEQPRGVRPEQEEREGKEANRHQPEENTNCTLDTGGVPGRPAPPSDEPAEKCNRVVRRLRITNEPVDGKREKEDCAG